MVALLDGHQIVTVEGMKQDGELHEIQKAMVENNGAQCGFCTPGFVMSMADLYENNDSVDEKKSRNYLTGNLCRCTGYSSILDAAVSVDKSKIKKLSEIYSNKISLPEGIEIKTKEFEFYAPSTLDEVLELKSKYNDIKMISSATDIGVQINKEVFEPHRLLSLQNIKEAYEINESSDSIEIGAKVNLTQLEKKMESFDSEFSDFLRIFASPQIKNFATLVGNIANASPIGDSLPYLSVMDAKLILKSTSGEREVPFNGFYTGYKQLDMKADEIIYKVIIPKKEPEELVKVYKVSRRKDLDISCVNAAVRLKKEGTKITDIKIAYGGVGPTVLKLPKLEKEMIGKEFNSDSFRVGSHLISNEITPMSDVRGSEEYRKLVAKNLFQRFYLDAKAVFGG